MVKFLITLVNLELLGIIVILFKSDRDEVLFTIVGCIMVLFYAFIAVPVMKKDWKDKE